MGFELFEWVNRFTHEGLTYGLRVQLLELLKPHVRLKAPFQLSEHNEVGELTSSQAPTRIKDLVDWEIVLGTSEVHEFIGPLASNDLWQKALPDLLPSFTSLLRDALDLRQQLEGADARSDGSYWHQPSIAAHSQNQKFRDWTALIDLTRDAWLAASTSNPIEARAEVQRWLATPYPLFRRLAFFSATETDLFSPQLSLQWLLAGEHWWLWSVETEHEALRLITKLAKILTTDDEDLLQYAILQGPPREMFEENIEPNKYQRIADREIWLRLSKYKETSGKALNSRATATLIDISERFPEWQTRTDESDEFPVWVGDSGDWYKKQTAPKDLAALEKWLRIEHSDLTNDDWSDRCKEDFSTAITALVNLAKDGAWPTQRWRAALQVWSDPSFLLESWQQLKTVLVSAGEEVISTIAQPLSWWLQALGKVIPEGESTFIELIHLVLSTQVGAPYEDGSDPIFKAINHPVGQSADAVFRWWYRQGLNDGLGLKNEPKGIFSELAKLSVLSFRYGRLILASNLIALFRVDRDWTEQYMLRNFDWRIDADEARIAWIGFLWAPRFYIQLFTAIKSQFLDTATHYEVLGETAQQYAGLLTYIALESSEPFTRKELSAATLKLPPKGLARCALSLVQILDSAGEKRAEYWQNRVRPYIRDIWPKSVEAITPSVANSFVRLCMKTDGAFPEAVSELKPWLTKQSQGDVTLYEFRETKLAKQFPDAALAFLDAVLTSSSFVLGNDLRISLNEIRETQPALATDPRFERLNRYARQHEG
jgi:hypothetical protein